MLTRLHLKDMRHEKGLKVSVIVTQQQKIVTITLRRINYLNKIEDRRSLQARQEE